MPRPSSPASAPSIAAAGASPRAIASSIAGPRYRLVIDCVDTAPTPARTNGQKAPTANALVATATAKAPEFGSCATMDQVMTVVLPATAAEYTMWSHHEYNRTFFRDQLIC